MDNEIKKRNRKILLYVVLINLFIFIIVNFIFYIKYEQVDDFIMYSLYSGLDSTYNLHAIYMHPALSIIISLLYRMISFINWHTIYLLIMQFICFTAIGYSILKKSYTEITMLFYITFVSIFYTTLLLLIQYTSVAALLIATSLFLIVDIIQKLEEHKPSKIKIITVFTLYTLGIMTRMQSLLIIAPFYALYFLIYLFKYKNINKTEIKKTIKYFFITFIITVIVYLTNFLIYNSNQTYTEYIKWNNKRAFIQDVISIDYEKDKDIYDEVGWSENDLFLFNTFGFGDENIFPKESLDTILTSKYNKDAEYGFETNIIRIVYITFYSLLKNETYIFLLFVIAYLVNINISNKNNILKNTAIFFMVILINIIFVIINRNMLRVVIPEYLIGTALMIYNIDLKSKERLNDTTIKCITTLIISIILCMLSGINYEFNYKFEDYTNYKEIINYTNSNKDKTFLYTIPSLQYRYLAYSVYEMPPKGSFSNLRQIRWMGYVYRELL